MWRSLALQLVYAIHTVLQGQQFLSPKVLTALVRQYISQPLDFKEGYDLLSDGGREILVFLAEGLSFKEITTKLDLSVKTVDANKYNLMRKLDLHDRSELISYAIRKKLVECLAADSRSQRVAH